MQVHVGPSMEKVELSSDLKFLSKIQIEWFKVLQIDQNLVRSDFVELNQELGDEFLNETNWMRTIPEKKNKWNRMRRFYLYCWDCYIDGVEEVQGQISQDQNLVRSDFVELNQELGDEFLNETNWMRTIPEKKNKWNRMRRFYLYCWDCYIDGVEEVQGQISQDANNSGEEEVVRTRILFILTGFLY
ncbi:uncharacterized protein [Lolium perenne]|uniref:uncharacterized protein isoform X1 n=1 Tax=Lolium perenne TaxID=4522 RepID=UPI0021F58B14|nr:uncharacterized protein LOC127327676 isoform X1 [Lolium perenne]XP_051210412.1 uncharacterized protein LOC127327676 isoform X2 [Lolium perenne]